MNIQTIINQLRNNKLDEVASLLEKNLIDVEDPILYQDIRTGQFPMAEVYERYINKREEILKGETKYLQFAVDYVSSYCDFIERKYNLKIKKSFIRIKSLDSIKNKIANLSIERIAKEFAILADFDDISTRVFENYVEGSPEQCKQIYKKDLISNLRSEKDEINYLLKTRINEIYDGPLSEEEEKEKKEYYGLVDDLLDFSKPIDYSQITDKLCTNQIFSKSTITAFSRIFYYRVCTDKEKVIIVNGKKSIEKIDKRDRDEYKYVNFNYIPDKDENDTNELRKNYNRPSIERTESISGDWSKEYSDPIYSSRCIRLLNAEEFTSPKDFIGADIVIDDDAIPEDFRLPEDTVNDEMNKINSDFNRKLNEKNPNDKLIYSSQAQKRAYIAIDNMIKDAKINAINALYYIVADSTKIKRKIDQDIKDIKYLADQNIKYLADHFKVAIKRKNDEKLTDREKRRYEDEVVEVQIHTTEIEKNLSLSHNARAGKGRKFPDSLKRVFSIFDGKTIEEIEEAKQAFADNERLSNFFYDQLNYGLPNFFEIGRDRDNKRCFCSFTTSENIKKFYEPYSKAPANSDEFKKYKFLLEMIDCTSKHDPESETKIFKQGNNMFLINPNSKSRNEDEKDIDFA